MFSININKISQADGWGNEENARDKKGNVYNKGKIADLELNFNEIALKTEAKI